MPTEIEPEQEVETTPCNRCDEAVAYSAITEVCNAEWCAECRDNHAFECDDCSNYFPTDTCGGVNSGGNRVCERCVDSYFSCNTCGDVYHNDDYAADGRCRHCYHDDDALMDDGAKPNLVPRGRGKHFYGIELEVELRGEDTLADEVTTVKGQLGGHAICKGDGSLSNGFEIVTSPASFAFHRDNLWEKFFASRHPGLKIMDSCGLHIHCSREPLSELSIAKMVCFVNTARNAKFMRIISGRPSSTYAKYKTKHIRDASKRTGDRYEAINLQPPHTIEFRLFKGTLNRAKLFKALEFCDAVIHFCAPADRSVRECLSHIKFCKYVSAHRKTYPHLHAFIMASWYGRDNKLAEESRFEKAANYKAKEID